MNYYPDCKKVPAYFNETGPGEYDINSTFGSFQHMQKLKNGPSFNFGGQKKYNRNQSMDASVLSQQKRIDFLPLDSDKSILKNPHPAHFGSSKRKDLFKVDEDCVSIPCSYLDINDQKSRINVCFNTINQLQGTLSSEKRIFQKDPLLAKNPGPGDYGKSTLSQPFLTETYFSKNGGTFS